MDKTLKLFEQWCKANNWIIKRNETPSAFPDKIAQRYPVAAKSDYFQFVKTFEMCYTDDERSWFLCEQDYKNEATATEFGWDIMEVVGLEAAEDDEERKSIQSWWNNHIPIFLSVRDGYSHFSMSLQENSFGQIVEGYEPIFEDVIVVANSLKEFLEKIMKNGILQGLHDLS